MSAAAKPARARQDRPAAKPVEPVSGAPGASDAGGTISWRHCLIGLLAGEALLLVLTNVARWIANAAFGPDAFSGGVDGGVVGVSTLLAVLFGGYLAARLAGRFGMYQGLVVGAGFILIGASFEFAQEAQVVHQSLQSGTHTLVDLGPMNMGGLISGDLLALFAGSVGGLLSRKR